MPGSICLRCRASMRHCLFTGNSTRTPISLSRTYSTSEARQEMPAEASAVGRTSIPPTEGSSDRFIQRSVKLHGTRITTPLSPKPEDQILPVRRVFARLNVDYAHQKTNIRELLSKPTWSVRSLLPSHDEKPVEEITAKQLHHLCRLSALPIPKTPIEEKKLLDTLHLQLHFLRDIQKVDTDGIEPLRSIRDETLEAEAFETIGLETEEIKAALEKEEYEGRNKRPRRRTDSVIDTKGVENWNVTGTASETVDFGGGKYFVVRSGKETAEKVEDQMGLKGENLSHTEKERLETPGVN